MNAPVILRPYDGVYFTPTTDWHHEPPFVSSSFPEASLSFYFQGSAFCVAGRHASDSANFVYAIDNSSALATLTPSRASFSSSSSPTPTSSSLSAPDSTPPLLVVTDLDCDEVHNVTLYYSTNSNYPNASLDILNAYFFPYPLSSADDPVAPCVYNSSIFPSASLSSDSGSSSTLSLSPTSSASTTSPPTSSSETHTIQAAVISVCAVVVVALLFLIFRFRFAAFYSRLRQFSFFALLPGPQLHSHSSTSTSTSTSSSSSVPSWSSPPLSPHSPTNSTASNPSTSPRTRSFQVLHRRPRSYHPNHQNSLIGLNTLSSQQRPLSLNYHHSSSPAPQRPHRHSSYHPLSFSSFSYNNHNNSNNININNNLSSPQSYLSSSSPSPPISPTGSCTSSPLARRSSTTTDLYTRFRRQQSLVVANPDVLPDISSVRDIPSESRASVVSLASLTSPVSPFSDSGQNYTPSNHYSTTPPPSHTGSPSSSTFSHLSRTETGRASPYSIADVQFGASSFT